MKNIIASTFLVAVFSLYALSKPAAELSPHEDPPAIALETSSSSSEEVSSSSASSESTSSPRAIIASSTPAPVARPVAIPEPVHVPSSAPSSQPVVVVPRSKPKASSSSRAPASVAPPPPPASSAVTRGQFADGTYTSPSEDAYYGDVQISVTVVDGAIAEVQFLKHPSGSGESNSINSRAMPVLKKEAIKAQSGHVNAVSGATYTSQAFNQALSSIVSQAKA